MADGEVRPGDVVRIVTPGHWHDRVGIVRRVCTSEQMTTMVVYGLDPQMPPGCRPAGFRPSDVEIQYA